MYSPALSRSSRMTCHEYRLVSAVSIGQGRSFPEYRCWTRNSIGESLWSNLSCWSGGYEQRVVSQSQPKRRKNEQHKGVSGLPGNFVPPCHYVWACKGGSIYAGHPTQQRLSQKGVEYLVYCWKSGTTTPPDQAVDCGGTYPGPASVPPRYAGLDGCVDVETIG